MGTTAEKSAYLAATKAAIAVAIEAQGVTISDTDTFRDYATKIGEISGGTSSGWTGHADSTGLAAIGWTDDDIAYYQAHGVNWDEEDDEYHTVNSYDKKVYTAYNNGTITSIADVSTSYPYTTYLPKFNTTGLTSLNSAFYGMQQLVAIPELDTSSVTDFSSMFFYCVSLVCHPPMDMDAAVNLSGMYMGCSSIVHMVMPDTPVTTNFSAIFMYCTSLCDVTFGDTSSVTDLSNAFWGCTALKRIGELDCTSVTTTDYAFDSCVSLEWCYLSNIGVTFDLSDSILLNGFSYNWIAYYAKTATDSPYMGFPFGIMESLSGTVTILGTYGTTAGTIPNTDYIGYELLMLIAGKGWTFS